MRCFGATFEGMTCCLNGRPERSSRPRSGRTSTKAQSSPKRSHHGKQAATRRVQATRREHGARSRTRCAPLSGMAWRSSPWEYRQGEGAGVSGRAGEGSHKATARLDQAPAQGPLEGRYVRTSPPRTPTRSTSRWPCSPPSSPMPCARAKWIRWRTMRTPFKASSSAIDDREAEARGIFDAADLKAIFGTAVYAQGTRPRGGGGEAAFWLPLIALLTGARQNELAELRVEDLRQDIESGLWFFDIGTEGGRSIKTASSRRKVPMHPHLEHVGLLRYRQSLIDQHGGDLLWPDVKPDAQGRRAGRWSKWFNRDLRVAAKVTDPARCSIRSDTPSSEWRETPGLARNCTTRSQAIPGAEARAGTTGEGLA